MVRRRDAAISFERLANHLDRAQQMSNTGSWEWDIVTNGLMWSPHIFRIFGLVPDAFEPTFPRFLERVFPEDRILVEEGVRRAIEGIEPYEIDHRIVLPDGSIRIVHERGDIEYGPDGQAIRMLGAVADVTDARVSMVAARQTTQMLESILQISPEAIIVTDSAGDIQLFSAGAQLMYGYSPEEVIGLPLYALAPAYFREIYTRRVDAFIGDRIPSLRLSEGFDVFGLRKNGEDFPVEISFAKLDTEGSYAFMVLARDLTDWKSNERRLIEARQEAERANLAKSTFLANMSHEIRTPLNGVLGVAAALARTELSPKQTTMVELICTSGRALDGLLSDILDLAKVDAGRMLVRSEPFDLSALVRDTLGLYRASAAGKGVNFGLNLETGARGYFLGDDLKIRQVLSNLLSNAVKFTDQGVVRLTVAVPVSSVSDCRIRISVEDTGVGIVPQYLGSLFERFQQADSSLTRRFGGTGLGLAISKSLVELMGGDIEASSELGQGSTFTFELPLSRIVTEPTTAAGADSALAPIALKPARILLAEDHAINRQTVEMILSGLPVELTCVENGQEAVQAAEAQSFDLIFMDIQMPVMDGLTAIRHIRQREAAAGRTKVPICVLTAMAQQAHRASAEAMGVETFLTKPIDVTALINLVETIAASRA